MTPGAVIALSSGANAAQAKNPSTNTPTISPPVRTTRCVLQKIEIGAFAARAVLRETVPAARKARP